MGAARASKQAHKLQEGNKPHEGMTTHLRCRAAQQAKKPSSTAAAPVSRDTVCSRSTHLPSTSQYFYF
jgi:hypothetical protein